MFARRCPSCSKEIVYTTSWRRDAGERKSTTCRKCSWTPEKRANCSAGVKAGFARHETDRSGSNNSFYGRHHSPETLNHLRQIDKSYTKTAEFSDAVKSGMPEITGRSLYVVWTKKLGIIAANQRYADWIQRLSVSTRGPRNPMFGRPSPPKSGNGWKGHYGSWFFRSLLELSYALQLDANGVKWVSAERKDLRVPWEKDGVQRTYVADFLVENNRLVECKPRALLTSREVSLKVDAAQVWCAQNGFEFEIVTPNLVASDILRELIDSGVVKLTNQTQKRWREWNA